MAQLMEVTGVVIFSAPVGEYDKRVVLLTKELGKISAFARGARRTGSPLMAAAETFAFGTFTVFAGRNSYTLDKADVKVYFRELAVDVEAAYYGYYFLELADYFAREGVDESANIELLYYAFRALLDNRIPNRLVRVVYELKLLVINGEYPDFFSCVNCHEKDNLVGFSVSADGLVCGRCIHTKNVIRIGEAAVYTLQTVVSRPTKDLYTFVVTDDVLRELEKVMEKCMARYIDKKVKSLDILETII